MKYTLIIGSHNPNLEWLKEAQESAEGLFDEYILVDDGSDIPIEGACRHEVNKGFWEARNTGVRLATGDIICWLDDDDTFIRDAVIEMKKFVENNDSDIWTFPCKEFGKSNGLWGISPIMDNIVSANQIVSGSWYKRDVWEKLGGYDNCLAEDWSFWVRAYKKGLKFTHSNKPVYNHRIRTGSLSDKIVGDKFTETQKQIKQIYEDTPC